jgi:hypothetical protein
MRFTTIRRAAVAAAAAASLATGIALAAAPAGAATGPPIATSNQAGYQVSGAQFRFVSTTFTLPHLAAYPNAVEGFSVKLRNGSETLVLGISDEGPWNAAFAQEYPDGTIGYSDATGPNMASGDNVTASIYYARPSGEVFYTTTDNTTGTQFTGSFTDKPNGALESFTSARVTSDFATDEYMPAASFTPPLSREKLVAFKDSRVTTYSGHHGSLTDWYTTSELDMFSGPHTDAIPGNLWGGGENFSVFALP